MITSFIRYVGSKSKALDTILNLIPQDIEEYREPMVGSGAVILGLLQTRKRPKKIAIGDLDYDIYNLWKNVIYNTEELLKRTISIRNDLIKTNDIKSELYTFGIYGVDAAAITLISNICRQYGNFGVIKKERLLEVEKELKYKLFGTANLMEGIEIRHNSYEWAIQEDGKNVCIFLDPPYYNVSAQEGYYLEHKQFSYDRLTKCLRDTKHKFIMTLDVSDYSESLKKYFKVKEYQIFYTMSKRWETEYIITNF